MFDEASEDDLITMAMTAKGVAMATTATGTITSGQGAAFGAKLANKLTKKDVTTTTLTLPAPPEAAAKHIADALESAGRLVATESREEGALAVRGMVAVGMGGLKPVVITAVVTPAQAGSTGTGAGASHVALRAAGRDSLVKQHPADKGLAKILALLTPQSS